VRIAALVSDLMDQSRVDRALLDRARRDGADHVMPRSQFFEDPAAAVTG
jgi:hypothetical protein